MVRLVNSTLENGHANVSAISSEMKSTESSEPLASPSESSIKATMETPVHDPSASPQPVQAQQSPSLPRKRQTYDFKFGSILGEGSYSTVLSATEISTGRHFAVKMLDKRHIVREKKTKYVTVERDVLNRIHHPFVIKLFYTFQDDHSLYFVLELAAHGDLLGYLKQVGRFEMDSARFYMAEVVCGVKFLHDNGVIHRDLKPENILLSKSKHIKIADFGTAKILDSSTTPSSEPSRRASFVGTAEYCSPELLNDREASHASDVWAIGCIMYQLLVGQPPFRGSNEYQTFQCIIQLKYMIPDEIDADSASLIKDILKIVPKDRPGLTQVQAYAFFNGVEWVGLEKREAPVLRQLDPLLNGVNDEDNVDRLADDIDELELFDSSGNSGYDKKTSDEDHDQS
ncbi:serine/threonine protein kinase [Batrachochytrium dendrobatidis]|nr:serine/threonine protein kinase [Batrachochytrium dendrobatidis]